MPMIEPPPRISHLHAGLRRGPPARSRVRVQARYLLVLCLFCFEALAGYPLTIIGLHDRSADEVIPIIQPFVAADGALSGTGDELFIRTSPANLTEIRAILQRIDRPPRRLMISVRQTSSPATIRRGENTRPGEHNGVALGGIQGATGKRRDLTQRVQALEGRPAFITVGQSTPVAERQIVGRGDITFHGSNTRYRNASTGFYALPRLNGDRVTLYISRQQVAPTATSDRFTTRGIHTQVSGQLGEWLLVGTSSDAQREQRPGIIQRGATRGRGEFAVYLKVDEIP